MTETSIEHLWLQLMAAVETEDPDPELFLDACTAINQLLDKQKQLEATIANLRAENATLKQVGFYE